MKTWLALVASVVVTVVAVVVIFNRPAQASIHVHLRSNPFPMTVGTSTLFISVSDTDGMLIEDASIEVSAEMDHMGMLPTFSLSTSATNGEYQIPVIWSMAGHWTLNVTADLPDQRGTVQDQFTVYVYPVPPAYSSINNTYLSASEIDAAITANAAKEYWIVIPQGTQEMIRAGQGDDTIPAEIRLSVRGQNVLVIRNNDIADHTVGPYFIRAGETIRHEFMQPATFVGVCTVRHSAEVSIIVEG